MVEYRQANPLIDLRLLTNRAFAGYTIAGTMANATWSILIFAITMQLQTVALDTAMQTGLIFLFMSSTVAIASFIAPAIQPKLGTKRMVIVTVGNMGIVVSASLMTLLSGPSGTNNEPGIQASYLLAIGFVVVGLVITWFVVPRDTALPATD